ncbi:MAG TPA: asparagine synthase (glutamine-hydrolyzing) [Sphingomicrobium sp.]|nr:asparagine synthase (glutamine-hydrolyzing) [Sphingomicrobium sp.]
MCGIAGLISTAAVDDRAVARLIRPIAHRGPDDDGIWLDAEAGVGLGHRRLAIVDLSPAGHQPMLSADGRLVLTFNGEIYNHADLRGALEAQGAVPEGGWRGHSDTEVFLHGIVTWGLAETLRRSAGMFAFAVWDRKARTLALVRDRFGEKPLYYGWAGRDFLFGSELKALRAHPRFDNAIDRRALGQFASRTYIPAPLSIYQRVFKLPPGCILTLDREAAARPLDEPPAEGTSAGGLALDRYWSHREVVRRGLDQPIADEREALEELEQVLATAIRGQSMADVPVGAFLSGGIDSSTICGLYQKYSNVPVRTFSIGFEEAGYDEAKAAKRVAQHLGTVHDERYVTVREARDVIPLLPGMYDEPFADSSQIPTHLVSRFAREQVTVALTGDGGDELFAGYNRHFAAPRLWRQLQKVPQPLRAATGSPLSRVPSQFWSGMAGLFPGRRQPHLGGKLQKAFRLAASAGSFDEVYCSFLDEWSQEPSPVIGADPAGAAFDLAVGGDAPDAVRMMYCDSVSYLPDDILAKVDRAAMAVALETRVPFLDHRVAELAARIPLALKIRGGRGKQVLRRLLDTLVPRDLIERPKAGFAIPVGAWIKGPLRHWAEELLEPGAMRADGWLDPDVVQRRWRDHLSGRRDSTPAIWAILMFQAWLRAQRSAAAEAA